MRIRACSLFRTVPVALLTGLLLSCGGSDPVEPQDDPIVSITLTPASDTVGIEETTTLTARVLTQGGSDVTSSTTLSWSSLASAIAQVTGNGATATVRGVAAGLAEIRASADGRNGSANVRVLPPPPAITTTVLPSGEVGVAYDQTLTATDGDGAYAWSVSAGSLPGGLTLGASTGAITGTPTVEGAFTFTILVTSSGLTDTQEFTVNISPEGGSVRDVVVNVDFVPSVDPALYDDFFAGDTAVYSVAGGTTWNAVSPFASRLDALDQFGDPTVVDVIENVSGIRYIGAAAHINLLRNGIISGDLPENGFRFEDLEAEGVYDLAFYVHTEGGLWFTEFNVTHAGGVTTLGPLPGVATWGLPGEVDRDYALLEGVSPYEISPGVYGFLINTLNDEGAITAVQLRGPAAAP